MSFWGPQRFHTTKLGFMFSVTSYLIAFSFASLVTAPLSELFGRKRIYQVATLMYVTHSFLSDTSSAILFIPQALTTNLALLLSMRALQGIAASAGNALIGGSITDQFNARERSLPMNLFVLANLIGQGIAAVVLGWTGMYAGIQWCYGVQAIALGVGVGLCLLLSETRSDVLLARRAARLTRETGVLHVAPGEESRQVSLAAKVRVSCVRPIRESTVPSYTANIQSSCSPSRS